MVGGQAVGEQRGWFVAPRDREVHVAMIIPVQRGDATARVSFSEKRSA